MKGLWPQFLMETEDMKGVTGHLASLAMEKSMVPCFLILLAFLHKTDWLDFLWAIWTHMCFISYASIFQLGTWDGKAVVREKEWKKYIAAFEGICGHFILGILFWITWLQMSLLIPVTPIKIIFSFFLLFLYLLFLNWHDGFKRRLCSWKLKGSMS